MVINMGKRKKKATSKSPAQKEVAKNGGKSRAKKPLTPPIQRPMPLMAQVEQTLRKAIADNSFPSGKLPTLIELAEELRVSRETVRLALDSLQSEGLIVKRRRQGTFVSTFSAPGSIKARQRKVIGYLIEEGFIEEYKFGDSLSEVVSQSQGSLILSGAIIEAGRHNYQVLTASAQPSNLYKAFEQINEPEPISGIILACLEGGKLHKRVVGRGIPAVIVDHDMNVPKIGSVRPDSYQNARLAVSYLAELGHRKIACAQWRQIDLNPWFLRGYRQGLRAEKIKRCQAWELLVELSEKGAMEALDQLMKIPQRPTAIICFHNTFASQLVAVAQQQGYKIPEDLCIMGGGGEEVMDLTCTQLNWQDLGKTAVNMLLKAIDAGKKYKTEHITIPYELREGKTTTSIKVGE